MDLVRIMDPLLSHDRPTNPPQIGAIFEPPDSSLFRVWAPSLAEVNLEILGTHPRRVRMTPESAGYHSVRVEGVTPGTRYHIDLPGVGSRPDPASRSSPTACTARRKSSIPPSPGPTPLGPIGPLADYVIYELHVGTFTPEGTFDAAIGQLDRLRDLGITAIELMPVAQFPGDRNWGYDGAYPFAVQASYGGPAGLQRFVDACHARGLAVILDVVYNHLGPEGNYVRDFGPYFTDQYRTPWGDALNFDGPGSDDVRALLPRQRPHVAGRFPHRRPPARRRSRHQGLLRPTPS